AGMGARDAADASTQAATLLVQAMKDTKNYKALSLLAEGLSAVATRMDAKDAARAAPVLIQAILDTNGDLNPMALTASGWLSAALSVVASRVDARGAAQAATILVQATTDGATGVAVPSAPPGGLAD